MDMRKVFIVALLICIASIAAKSFEHGQFVPGVEIFIIAFAPIFWWATRDKER
jgi:hypothetical protein